MAGPLRPTRRSGRRYRAHPARDADPSPPDTDRAPAICPLQRRSSAPVSARPVRGVFACAASVSVACMASELQICGTARRDRRGRRLERADRERLLREPGRGIAFIDDDAVVLGRIPRRHVRQLIDGAAFVAELRRNRDRPEEQRGVERCHAHASGSCPGSTGRSLAYVQIY